MLCKRFFSHFLAVALAAAASAVLGWPQVASVGRFFAGGIPSTHDAVAVASLLAWLVILGLMLALVAGMTRRLPTTQTLRSRRRRAALVCAAGLLLLMMALLQRGLEQPSSICCGGDHAAIEEALSLAR